MQVQGKTNSPPRGLKIKEEGVITMTQENTIDQEVVAIDLSTIDFAEQSATAIKAHKKALDAFLKDNKDEIAELSKAEQAVIDAETETEYKARFKASGLKEGDTVGCKIKGEIIDYKIVKITDKTVSVDAGKDKPTWRYYRWLDLPAVEVADEVEESTEA
jgi:hypothetical protein